MRDHAAIVLRDGKKALFVQRAACKKTLPDIWAFPSGTIEEGEVAEETVIREAKEELGVEVEIEKLLTVVELPELSVRLHFLECKNKTGEPIEWDPGEIQAVRWLTFEEFFSEYDDEYIGHGLRYIRKREHMWR